jgi:hypothetical protein
MNGLPLLLLATTVGMDFGWQPAVDNPNMLEYIIQLSPEEVQLLNSGKEELFSGIPQELKGRIDRVVIRMGREKLPQEPSLEKLRTMAAVGGNPSILNAGGSAGGTSLAPPSLASSIPLSPQGGLATIDPPRTLPSFGSANGPAPPPPISYAGNYDILGSGAYEDLLRQGTMPPGTFAPATLPNVGSAGSLAEGNGVPAIPVTQLGNNGGASTLPPDPRSTFSGAGTSFSGNGGSGNQPTTPPSNNSILPREGNNGGFFGANGNSASGNNLNGNNGGVSLPAGGWNSATNPASTAANPPRGTSTGAPVGFNNNSMAGNTLGNNPNILPSNNGANFNGSPVTTASNNGGFTGAPTQYPPSGGNNQFGTNPTLIASSNAGNNSLGSGSLGSGSLGSGSLGSGSLGASSSFDDDELSASADKAETADETSAAISASNWEKVLQILFILSVVLNFYLGVHLHKLLLRYRTLLSSVRASATVA